MRVRSAAFVAWCTVGAVVPRAVAETPAPPAATPAPPPATATPAPKPAPPATATPPPKPAPPATATPPPKPAPPAPDRGPFVGLWVVPWASQQFLGAGLDGGYHARWIGGQYRVGILQNGYAPVSGAPVLTLDRTQRIFLELEANARWRFSKPGTLTLGGGVAVFNDFVDTTSMNGLAWTTTTDSQWRARPLVSLMVAGPVFFTTTTLYIESHPEGTFALGVSWGRR